MDDFVLFTIDGRADGIITNENQVIIDEIKTVTCDYEDIHEDRNPAHWAQAYGYAYIYAKQHELEEVIVQLTYYQIDLDQIKQFRHAKTFAQLEQFYMEMLEEYREWAMRHHNFTKIRDLSIQNLAFPLPNIAPDSGNLPSPYTKPFLTRISCSLRLRPESEKPFPRCFPL